MPHGRVTPLQSFPCPYGYLHGEKNSFEVSLPLWYFCIIRVLRKHTLIADEKNIQRPTDSIKKDLDTGILRKLRNSLITCAKLCNIHECLKSCTSFV